MCAIPKKDYLFGTRSSLGPEASFGLDFGEIYRRSVIGVRFKGVDPQTRAGLVAFFQRMNADYQADLQETEYHSGRIAYDYMNLNCAKTIAYAFKHGAGWRDLRIKGTGFLDKLNPFKPMKANVPMETTLDLIEGAARRGWDIESCCTRNPGSRPGWTQCWHFKPLLRCIRRKVLWETPGKK